MAHPFTKIFERALKKKVDEGENAVRTEAQKIIQKGYAEIEVVAVLEKLLAGRIDEDESNILEEALQEFRVDPDDLFDED